MVHTDSICLSCFYCSIHKYVVPGTRYIFSYVSIMTEYLRTVRIHILVYKSCLHLRTVLFHSIGEKNEEHREREAILSSQVSPSLPIGVSNAESDTRGSRRE